MPSVSPSAPISRTSFAVISSLSRFSLSFALIVKHLQAKKNNRTKTQVSARHSYRLYNGRKALLTRLLLWQEGESGELCFVFCVIIHHSARFVKGFFYFFLDFFIFFPENTAKGKTFTKKHKMFLQFTNKCVMIYK